MDRGRDPLPTLLLLGAGGHACVVADAALRQGAWSGVSASDGDPARFGGELLPGVPRVARGQALALAHAALEAGAQDGEGEGLPALSPRVALHMAIGDNASRRREAQTLPAPQQAQLARVVHPQASVSPHAVLGPGCFVAAQAVVAPRARLGAGVIVNHGAVVDHDAHLGDFAHISPGATLAGGVRVGAGVLVGAGARLLPGVSVCEGATVGAGAVVVKNITEPGVFAGVPARRIS